MEEVVEPWSVHALHVGVLVTPGKGLLTDDSVDRVELRDVRIIDILAVLQEKVCINITYYTTRNILCPCDSRSANNQLLGF